MGKREVKVLRGDGSWGVGGVRVGGGEGVRGGGYIRWWC